MRTRTAAVLGAVVVLASGCTAQDDVEQAAPAATSEQQPLPVLEVGALSGPDGDALTWLREQGTTGADLQWVQFTDPASMVDDLALGGTDAVVVAASEPLTSASLPDTSFTVVASVYDVVADGERTTQVLVTTADHADAPGLTRLAEQLADQATLDQISSTGASVEPVD